MLEFVNCTCESSVCCESGFLVTVEPGAAVVRVEVVASLAGLGVVAASASKDLVSSGSFMMPESTLNKKQFMAKIINVLNKIRYPLSILWK